MKWLKFFIGIALLPFLVAEVITLVDFTALWIPTEPWRALWFWSAWSGVMLWIIIFFCLPRPLWIYVLGHEFTHALAVYMTGGKVYDFRVASSGGSILSNKSGWWISLSPYFVPLYTLIWLGLWWSVNFYYPLTEYYFLLYFGIGFTYAFHVTFTISMLHPGQTDLSSEGYLFSTVLVLAMNLVCIAIFFIFMISKLSSRGALALFVSNLETCYFAVGIFVGNIAEMTIRSIKTATAA